MIGFAVVILNVVLGFDILAQGYYGQPLPPPAGQGGIIFPIYDPYAESDRQKLAAFEEGCRRLAEMTTTPQVQEVAGQFSGLNTVDGSAQLFQATMQNYQMIDAQNQQAYRQLDQITADVMKIQSGNYTQEDVTRWQRQAENASRACAMADAYNATYQMQSQELERDQKRAANLELYNETGKEYWQYTSRPVEPGTEQDAYDRCNQVYRRWE